MSGKPRGLDAGHLHAEADTEERHASFTRKADAGDLAFAAALPEPARHKNAMHRLEPRRYIRFFALEYLGVDPADIDLDPVRQPAMDQRLVERLVGILQADILADHTDGHLAFGVEIAVGHIVPARKVRRRRIGDPETAQDFAVEPLMVVLQRHRIDRRCVKRGDDRFLAHIAEIGDFLALALGDRMLAAA